MPDRPLECTECQRAIAVHYTEVAKGQQSELAMCNECPVLQRKLRGVRSEEGAAGTPREPTAGICCGRCGTTLESVRTGSRLGCAECYEAFADVIVFALAESGRISHRLESTPSARAPLHVGHKPGEAPALSPEIKLVALQDALEETLKQEDYEQAAWLRDQIKALEEGLDEGQKG